MLCCYLRRAQAGECSKILKREATFLRNMSKSYKIRNYDYVLLFMTIGIAVFGVFMIYSAGYYTAVLTGSQWRYVTQQVLGLGIGVVGMILVSGIDYRLFIKPIFGKKINFVYLVYLAAIIMQVAVLFVGVEKNGAKRWLNLGFVQFQPSEIYRSRQSLDHFAGFLRVMLFMGPSIVLILVENMSSAIIVSGIVVGMCFVGSRKKLYFAVCLVLLICGGACYIFLGEGFRAERIDIWLHVETNENAHQIKQGLYAIATGGVFGKGLGNSMQKLGYIPEAYNDMIFAVVCEELGIVGAAGLIIAFLVMFWRITWIAIKATDLFGTMICVGVLIQLAIQVVINVAVVTNSIPSTGIPLPLISYGGTSATIMMAEMGLVLSVSAGSK